MRRSVVVAVGAVVLSGTAVQPTAARFEGGARQRMQTVFYGPNPQKVVTVDSGLVTQAPGVSVASVDVRTRRGERAIAFEAFDDSGYPVQVRVRQGRSTVAWFCGASEGPVEVEAGADVTFQVFTGSCDGEPGIATTGSIEVTFLREAPRS